MTRGTLMIVGSGEIAPGMVKVYRGLLEDRTLTESVMLDTPFGFQENVPQITAKILDYFATSLRVRISVASFLRDDGSPLARASFAEAVRRANFVFSGPGSPSYAIKQWRDVPLRRALTEVLDAGGVVCFASAAAVTLGRHTAPIYELYKVGEDPFWLEGLDLMADLDLNCVVIPHFDNAEGGNHDTRFCYLGERRLRVLEGMLPDDVATLGVDEHTAVIFDLAEDVATVHGRGSAYWRIGAESRTLAPNVPVPLASLRSASPSPRAPSPPPPNTQTSESVTLGEDASRGGAEGLRAIAELVRRAESGGAGRIDPSPLVDAVLRARSAARAAGQYEIADTLRVALEGAGIEVRDTADGVDWALRTPSP